MPKAKRRANAKKNKAARKGAKPRIRTVRIPVLAPRPADAHKGSCGRIAVIAGSPGMVGAAVLASEAAYRSGAGLVYLCVPQSVSHIASIKQTCAVVRPQPDYGGALAPAAVAPLLEFCEECDAVALGPGLGQAPQTQTAVRQLVQKIRVPVVVDADGLNAFAGKADILRDRRGQRILTPHPAELARLINSTTRAVQADRERAARGTASTYRCILTLKGHGTIVTNGVRTYVNQTGNPGMATGGSGDVLTGSIAALIGQGLSPYDAAVLGVYLHGMAGDLAAEKYGQVSMMATDILEWLPNAFERHRARTQLAGM